LSDFPQHLTHHLEELRQRLIKSLVCYFILSILCYFFVDSVLVWLARPVGEFVFTAPTEAFTIRLKIAFGLGFVLAFPIFLYQGWSFVGVALRNNEKSMIKAVVPVSCFLFYFGMALALFGVAPLATKFLLAFATPQLRPLISLDAYLSFLLWMVVGFGILFQLPLAVVALCKLGVVAPETLSRYRRHVAVCIFIAAAFVTPGPDMFSQLLVAVPSYLLFEISLLVSYRVAKKE
jgi:sec-independent protein translocase protein TatC